MQRVLRFAALVAGLATAACAGPKTIPYNVEEKSIVELGADMAAGKVTSEALTQAYLARIETIDRNGPALHSVISLNPDALPGARALDAERAARGARGLLHGIPILIKDNIETKDPVPTTAGSLALKDNITHRDSPAIASLRAAGVVILGKTNLSEWANIRSSYVISGWSAIGGLVKNPYVLDHSACGSSSGSGVATATSLAAAAIGTETDGSLICPGSLNGIVSLKPTVGLVSRTYVVPISHSQDTPGPMGRTVSDVAVLLTAMAGSDPADPATKGADAHKTDYLAALAGATLNGMRLGVLPPSKDTQSPSDIAFAKAVARMKEAGALIVEIKQFTPPPPTADDLELLELMTELKADLDQYLAGTPDTVKTRSLKDVIAFNESNTREQVLFGQDLFIAAEATKGLSDPAYLEARAKLLAIGRTNGLDKLIAGNKLDALIMRSDDPASRTDIVRGDGASSSTPFLPAVAGYPHLTVPMAYVDRLPVGISFIGPAWSEAKLLSLGYAFEQLTHARRAPQYVPSLESTPEVRDATSPLPAAAH
jgi:amidase